MELLFFVPLAAAFTLGWICRDAYAIWRSRRIWNSRHPK